MQYFSNLIFVLLVIIIAVPATKAICDFFSIEPRVYISYMLWSIALLLFVTLLPSENKSDLMKFAPLVITAGVAVKKPDIPAVPKVVPTVATPATTNVAPKVAPKKVPNVAPKKVPNVATSGAPKVAPPATPKVAPKKVPNVATSGATSGATSDIIINAVPPITLKNADVNKDLDTLKLAEAAKQAEAKQAEAKQAAELALKQKQAEQQALKQKQAEQQALKQKQAEEEKTRLVAEQQKLEQARLEQAGLEQAAEKLAAKQLENANKMAALKQTHAEEARLAEVARLARLAEQQALKQTHAEQEAAEEAEEAEQARLEQEKQARLAEKQAAEKTRLAEQARLAEQPKQVALAEQQKQVALAEEKTRLAKLAVEQTGLAALTQSEQQNASNQSGGKWNILLDFDGTIAEGHSNGINYIKNGKVNDSIMGEKNILDFKTELNKWFDAGHKVAIISRGITSYNDKNNKNNLIDYLKLILKDEKMMIDIIGYEFKTNTNSDSTVTPIDNNDNTGNTRRLYVVGPDALTFNANNTKGKGIWWASQKIFMVRRIIPILHNVGDPSADYGIYKSVFADDTFENFDEMSNNKFFEKESKMPCFWAAFGKYIDTFKNVNNIIEGKPVDTHFERTNPNTKIKTNNIEDIIKNYPPPPPDNK